MTERRPTIADVARHVGMSKGSVSLALNGRPGIAEATRTRIMAAAEELQWQPSRRGRALSVSRAYALGLVIARDPALLGSDPFFSSLIAGVESVLAEHGQALVLQVVAPGAAEEDGYRRLAREAWVDGVLVTDLRNADSRIGLIDELALPAVTLNRPDVASPFPVIGLDDRPGIAEAVRHLAGLGHTRIAHVAGPQEFLHGNGRRQAFLDTMAELGLPPGPVEIGDFTAASGTQATRRVLDATTPPTAIVYANDVMAMAGRSVAQEYGIEVPAQLSMTGYDDTELAGHVHPPLTTVRTDILDWGRAAARALLALVDGEDVADLELPPGRLVVRHSTAPPPGIEPPDTESPDAETLDRPEPGAAR